MRTALRRFGTRLSHFRRRSAAGKRLRLQALAVLVGVRTALWALPFARVRRYIERGGSRETTRRLPCEDIIAAVQAAARDLPRTDCLSQALALRFLLVRHGYPADVHVSVKRQENGALRAHAWVQSGPLTAPCGAVDLSGHSDASARDFEV